MKKIKPKLNLMGDTIVQIDIKLSTHNKLLEARRSPEEKSIDDTINRILIKSGTPL
jgi:hypothetical protein